MGFFSSYWIVADIFAFAAAFTVFLIVFMAVQSAKGPGWQRLIVLLAAPVFLAIALFVLYIVASLIGSGLFGGLLVYLILRMPVVATAAYIAAAVCFCAKLLVSFILKRTRRQGPGAMTV